MTPETSPARGTRIAIAPRTMKRVAPLVAVAALAVPAVASAQSGALPSGWMVTRVGSGGASTPAPRAWENSGTVPAPTAGGSSMNVVIGLRDCECGELWNIHGTHSIPAPGGASQFELWVGKDMSSCQNA